jgi:hypothetical protein
MRANLAFGPLPPPALSLTKASRAEKEKLTTTLAVFMRSISVFSLLHYSFLVIFSNVNQHICIGAANLDFNSLINIKSNPCKNS